MRNAVPPYERFYALGIALALQVAAVVLLMHSLPRQQIESTAKKDGTQIVFLPVLPPPVLKKRDRRPQKGRYQAPPFVNPYTFDQRAFRGQLANTLTLALSACDIDHLEMETDEIKSACQRIGSFIHHDPEHFGMTSDVADPRHWATELLRRESPVLMPCMSPSGVKVDLICVGRLLFEGYDPEKRARYNN
ncbi:hypothetical protein FHS83_003527 [Rhizomicrobium palustre]|uniref:Uncharacterized protein n=1 Tax=Rhizomicrobium palustre TaxID=189966 RepID=A0A846N3X5_9PROT|nr:hypothetical protein [Rhizomicrobium palustre]NIK90209.1 hypothetical protein [Rhizomicrobium palustre]